MARPPRLFDHRLRDLRRRRAYGAKAAGADFLLRAASDDLVDRLQVVKRRFDRAVDVGSASSYLAERLLAAGMEVSLVRIDRVAESRPDIIADHDALPLRAGSQDLIVSALALHWSDDLPGALVQIRQALKPDGVFLAALLGGDTLIELRQAITMAEVEFSHGAAPRVMPFVDLRDMGALLQRAGFALPVVDRERTIVRYDSARHLMHDLRAMGATNVLAERSRRPLARAVLDRCDAIYGERFSDPDGRVRATFDVISLSGWAPHASQQIPLKPGSATVRLADALATREISTGEKTGH